MSNIKEIQQIKSLIAKGKVSGFLTFDEVNKALPAEVNTPEQIEEIIGIFDQLDIAIVDSEKDGKKISMSPGESEEEAPSEGGLDLSDDEETVDYSSRSTDPVRMYLREMGSVPLLDRDGEVVIAKKIEMGEQDVLYALVEVPVAVEELVNVGEDLKQNRIKLKDVVKTIEEDDPSEDEMNQRQRVILLLEEIRTTFKKKRKVYSKLDECCTLERRVASVQREIMNYKEDIVSRLRDIKLEKTLIDRIIETVEDYVRRCTTASATSLRTSSPPARRRPRYRRCSAGSKLVRSARSRLRQPEHDRRRTVLVQGDDPRQDRDPFPSAG